MTFAVCLGILGLTLLVVSCIGPSLAQNKKGNVVPDFWITDPNGRLTWLPYWPAWSKYVLLAAGVTMGVSACLGAISAWGLRCNEQRGRKGVASALSKMGVKLKSDG